MDILSLQTGISPGKLLHEARVPLGQSCPDEQPLLEELLEEDELLTVPDELDDDEEAGVPEEEDDELDEVPPEEVLPEDEAITQLLFKSLLVGAVSVSVVVTGRVEQSFAV